MWVILLSAICVAAFAQDQCSHRPDGQPCPTGEAYNSDLKICSPRKLVPVCGDVVSTKLCLGLLDGDYKIRNCWTTYVSCSGERTTERTCPDNTVFDDEFKECRYRENVKACPEFVELPPELPALDEALLDEIKRQTQTYKLCRGMPENSFLLHPHDCSQFIHCGNGIANVQKCAGNAGFNQTTNTCDGSCFISLEGLRKSTNPCPKHGDVYLGWQPCGTEFFYCWDGVVKTTHQCPVGNMFLELEQRCGAPETSEFCSGNANPAIPIAAPRRSRILAAATPRFVVRQPVPPVAVKKSVVVPERVPVVVPERVPQRKTAVRTIEQTISGRRLAPQRIVEHTIAKAESLPVQQPPEKLTEATPPVSIETSRGCPAQLGLKEFAPTACSRRFVRCVDGKGTFEMCRPGYVFNNEFEACESRADARDCA